MKLALFTSAHGDYVGVRRARLLDDLGVRAWLAAAIAVVIVTLVLTFALETRP